MARDALTDDNEEGANKRRDKAGISFRPLTSLQKHYMQLSEAAFRYVAFPNRKSIIFDNKLDFSGIKLAES